MLTSIHFALSNRIDTIQIVQQLTPKSNVSKCRCSIWASSTHHSLPQPPPSYATPTHCRPTTPSLHHHRPDIATIRIVSLPPLKSFANRLRRPWQAPTRHWVAMSAPERAPTRSTRQCSTYVLHCLTATPLTGDVATRTTNCERLSFAVIKVSPPSFYSQISPVNQTTNVAQHPPQRLMAAHIPPPITHD